MRIADYAMIGNSRTGAMVSRRGSIDWCCFPRFDSSSFFDVLLDPNIGGFFEICPSIAFSSEQSYLDDTNLLETRFRTDSGKVKLTDFFSVCSEEAKSSMLWPDHEILRVVEGVSGTVPMRLSFAPRADYARRNVHIRHIGNWALECHYGRELLVFQSSLGNSGTHLVIREGGLEAVRDFTIRAGERVIVSLSYADTAPAVLPPLGNAALERMRVSAQYWRNWISRCLYDGQWSDQVRRSALALKMLTFAPSGAVVAAPTTSLPETLGGIRNWDYRYCWLRDASFTVRAFMNLGYFEEARAYTSWLLHTTKLTQPKLQAVYSIYGESKLPEREIYWLEGYRHSRPVRVGNEAWSQLQFDAYGEVMNSVYSLLPHLDYIDRETRHFILDLGKAVAELWRLPDHGIWEMRTGRAQHTHSKVFCWVALDRIAKISKSLGWKPKMDYSAVAAEIRDEIENRGYSERVQSYTREFDSDDLDASLLALPLVGYCDIDSPRIQNTVGAIQRHLTRKGFVYRYRPRSDGLRGKEGTFGLCNFLMASVLARMGRAEEATYWFERVAGRAPRSGLLPEEFDPDSGEFLGNYPQAFTHIGLINSAIRIMEARKRAKAA